MLALCLALALAVPAVDPGEPFADLAFDPALARATQEKKLLLVDFTASWCGPCKKMEKDTWGAAEVQAWLVANAIAIQVDVDEDSAIAQRFRIEAMPTVVALRDGVEFDRVVGYRDPKGFLEWGGEMLAGRRKSDTLLARSKELRDSTDVSARYDLARELAQAGLDDEALIHYLWLWPATRSASGFGGVRTSFMLNDMARLANRHEPARKAFTELFDEVQTRVDAAEVPEFQDWQEWRSFCRSFNGNARIIAWYEKHRDAEGRLFAGQDGFQPQNVVADVFDVLISSGRPLDAVQLYEDAVERADQILASDRSFREANASLPEEERDDLRKFQDGQLIDGLARLHAALLLAGRADEAATVAAKLLATLDTPEARLGLVRVGLDLVKRPEPVFTRWLDEAEAAGANVRLVRKKLEKVEKFGQGSGEPFVDKR